VGGAFPFGAGWLALALWLPKSPRFLARKTKPCRHANAALLKNVSTSLRQESDAVDVAQGNPVAMLFGRGYALQTMLLWVV